MQPELIGALAGAGAATLVGCLALYGALRQVSAAHRAADVAAEAAREAAEAAREAAEHTTRATYQQWRQASQRDAAVAFALAAEDSVTACRDLVTGYQPITGNEEEAIFRSMGRAYDVVKAEGPQFLIEKAAAVYDIAAVISECAALHHLEATETGRTPDGAWSHDLNACEGRFRRLLHDFREALRTYLDNPPADRPEDEVRQELRAAA
ncbi:hypothetical protein ABT234_12285 [Streptomyces sp. NPDC001586]|uniref:hypothetical protein n=1 Tax=Streptomyces sp. NPDC001586 TaxID=3154387 RepID=UPI003321FAAF